MHLRPFQCEMIEQARDLLRRRIRRIILQSPTGSGKTVLCAFLLKSIVEREGTAWFIVHRRELILQSSQTLTNVGVSHGIVAASFNRSAQPVQICGVQSLRTRMARLQPPKVIVWDEAHHCAASTWAKIHEAYPQAIQLGLSATPHRLDGKGLGAFFDEIVSGPSVADLIAAGYLSPYRILAPPSNLDLSQVSVLAGEFNKKEVADAVAHSSITGDALAHYQRHALGRRAVMFHVSIDRSIAAVEAFRSAGICAEHVDGETPERQRDVAMARFREGRTAILSNVGLFGEGVDVPGIEVLIDCAPSRSQTAVLQRWGRALRPCYGKSHALILDHAGNCYRHGLPDDPREWSLEGARRRARKDAPIPIKTCPVCFAVVRVQRIECDCGHIFRAQARPVTEVAADLQEVDVAAVRSSAAAERKAARTLDDLIALGTRRRYKNPRAWAEHVHGARNRRG